MTETEPIMPEQGPQGTAPQGTGETGAPEPRRGPELLTLVAGLGALGVAATTLLGGAAWFPDLDSRWVLAALALIVGLLLVIGSLRSQKR